ncbi:hypothetical protein CONCODRAFT_84788 [Conidiobolus coronatus NRRL 28638]|uniref:F-box domain-containing protein n=1 Tax=Conidiobolus coronatus (strain ATCC 28846 / CBS 209.66 / NRRL 28638) TaxID=796925 RepID=A0A137P8I2_CONC2|nr:hypothetical protein CONCODRAFT_84788 [Conidiobolus coronatus NRRL 28638]|eukprot:KXN71310.1 hypothetical protein CONCODRAFT_84788 [Conidiobolus coronatus NRRL 28638]
MTAIESKIIKLEQVSGILNTNAFSTILRYLDRSSIHQLSLANKHLRQQTKASLFSKMALIPFSITAEYSLNNLGFAIISKEDEDYLNYLLEKYSKFIQDLTIFHFNNIIWKNHSQKFINLRSLTLNSVKTNQVCIVNLICSFLALKNLKIQNINQATSFNDTEIQYKNLPESLANFQIYNSNIFFNRGLIIENFFNTHSNLKILRVEHEKLLERLLKPYPSLEHLVIRLNNSTSMLRLSFLNLINLRTLDLLYTKLRYSDIESILKLRNLEYLKFNSKLELFNSDMKPILCTSLKQLAIRSAISPEWTEFFLNSCPNIKSFKLIYSKNSLIFTKPELFNQVKHLTIIGYYSEKFDLQTLLQSPNLKKLQIFALRSINDYEREFFESPILNSNWKFTKFNNCIALYK